MVDSFLGLRHHAVVRRHDDDGDIGHLGAARAHLGEGLVTGSVEEGDVMTVVLDPPGADDLGNAARFGRGDVALANLVQQRRLAVIHVSHDGHDGSARHEIFRVVRFVDFGQ